ERLRQFKTLNADLLNQEGYGIGTWNDTDSGKATLDIVKLFDDRKDAVQAGTAANQKAIYHLGGEGEIPTGGTGEGTLVDAMKKKYGTTNDVLKAGFILPEDQQRHILDAANKLKNGNIVLETVDGKNHQTIEMSTGAKVKAALDKLVTVKSDVGELSPESSEIATRRPTSTKADVTNASGQYADMAGVKAASEANPGGGGK